MKPLSLSFMAVLFLGACATAPENDREAFIQTVRKTPLTWVKTGTPLQMNTDGSMTDPTDSAIVYRLDEIINGLSAYYVWDQPLAKGVTVKVYSVFFMGVSVPGGKTMLGQGSIKNAYSADKPAVDLKTDSSDAEIAAWKTYYEKVSTKENCWPDRGVAFAIVN